MEGQYVNVLDVYKLLIAAKRSAAAWKAIAKAYREELRDVWLFRDCMRRASILYQEQRPDGSTMFPDGAKALAQAMIELQDLTAELAERDAKTCTTCRFCDKCGISVGLLRDSRIRLGGDPERDEVWCSEWEAQ